MYCDKLQTKTGRSAQGSFLLSFVLTGFCFLLSFCLWFLPGCGTHSRIKGALCGPDRQIIYAGFRQTELNVSHAADVLTAIHNPEYELISQGESVIASQGEKEQRELIWLKLVAFDSETLTARRKYLFIVEEKPSVLFSIPQPALEFNCKVVLEEKLLDEPYVDENVRLVAIIKKILENVRSDIGQVAEDNKQVATCGMMINQALETVLVKLEASPASAAKLDDEQGVMFDHAAFDKGKIRMIRSEDIVKVRLLAGYVAGKKADSDDMDF